MHFLFLCYLGCSHEPQLWAFVLGPKPGPESNSCNWVPVQAQLKPSLNQSGLIYKFGTRGHERQSLVFHNISTFL